MFWSAPLRATTSSGFAERNERLLNRLSISDPKPPSPGSLMSASTLVISVS